MFQRDDCEILIEDLSDEYLVSSHLSQEVNDFTSCSVPDLNEMVMPDLDHRLEILSRKISTSNFDSIKVDNVKVEMMGEELIFNSPLEGDHDIDHEVEHDLDHMSSPPSRCVTPNDVTGMSRRQRNNLASQMSRKKRREREDKLKNECQDLNNTIIRLKVQCQYVEEENRTLRSKAEKLLSENEALRASFAALKASTASSASANDTDADADSPPAKRLCV